MKQNEDTHAAAFKTIDLDNEGGGLAFYRCHLCAAVVSQWDIKANQGCGKCGGTKLSPSNLSLSERLIQIIKHPLIWKWHESVPTDA